ncbi:MAG TPA: hypothetical protein VFT43_10650, partial [Candidatus Polarisedimenticolia bacterium]|nr:hypothetical protein [Candidatus Polarisedimenticolia bacterium]
RMRLEGLSRRQAEGLPERFRPFTVSPDRFAATAGCGAPITVALRQAPVEEFLATPRGRAETYRLESRVAGERLVLWTYEFAGRVEAKRRRALLALVSPEGHLFERGLENFLRVLTASYVLESGGFLLHGSGVVRAGKAYVFFGPSGSGKTTVTHLSPGDTILSDDLTLVVRGEGGRYEAAGIPFGMAHHRVPETGASFPIASFNRLVQSRSVERESLGPARALAELAGSLPFVMQETKQAARALEVVARAVAEVPVHRLRFRKDDAFWGVVGES